MSARRRSPFSGRLGSRLPHRAGAAAAVLLAVACAGSPAPTTPAIRLVVAPGTPATAFVEVGGVDRAVLDAARRLEATSSEWSRLLTVHVVAPDGSSSPTAVAGRHGVTDGALRFTPLFPFDPGRRYDVRYDPSRLGAGGRFFPLQATVALPAAAPSAPTSVTEVFPSADVVPENQLRMYVHFSAPMGRRGGLAHVRLLDERGREVPEPFVPLEEELWNADRTRYTLLFDPGRQKRGIRPNREMGPSLVAGHRYTLAIGREWIDGHGQPLAHAFSRTFRVGSPELAALDPATWRIAPPAAGTREVLAVVFPRPLDHGLLQTALGVRRDGQPVAGEVRIEPAETRWTMTPVEAWRPGRYELVALPILEDRAGNRIGRAFELDPALARREVSAEPIVTAIPFTLR